MSLNAVLFFTVSLSNIFVMIAKCVNNGLLKYCKLNQGNFEAFSVLKGGFKNMNNPLLGPRF